MEPKKYQVHGIGRSHRACVPIDPKSGLSELFSSSQLAAPCWARPRPHLDQMYAQFIANSGVDQSFLLSATCSALCFLAEITSLLCSGARCHMWVKPDKRTEAVDLLATSIHLELQPAKSKSALPSAPSPVPAASCSLYDNSEKTSCTTKAQRCSANGTRCFFSLQGIMDLPRPHPPIWAEDQDDMLEHQVGFCRLYRFAGVHRDLVVTDRIQRAASRIVRHSVVLLAVWVYPNFVFSQLLVFDRPIPDWL